MKVSSEKLDITFFFPEKMFSIFRRKGKKNKEKQEYIKRFYLNTKKVTQTKNKITNKASKWKKAEQSIFFFK